MKKTILFYKNISAGGVKLMVGAGSRLVFTALLIAALSACRKSGFLDQKKLSQIDENTVFTDSLNSWNYVNSRYSNLTYSWEPTRWGRGGVDAASDEVQSANAPTEQETYWAGGAINPSNVTAEIWTITWQQVRAVNIFLKNQARIPMTANTKKLLEGQMRFLRAWYYATMLKTYGGFPLIGNAIFSDGDAIDLPRNTYEECLNYIISECDAAASLLPVDFVAATGNPADYGRATKGAALALKARLLLYAASPLINASRGDDPSRLVSLGSTNPNRWKLAADAAQAVINLGQYSLFRRVTPFFYNQFLNGLTASAPNSEAVFAFLPATTTQNNMIRETLANPATRATRYQSNGPSCFPLQELVDAFGMANGKAIDDPASGYPGIGNNMYLNRDPRFYASITYNGGLRFLNGKATDQPVWTYTGDIPASSTNDASISGARTDGIYTATGTRTGYFAYKMLANNVANGGVELNRPRILIRYAEVLLNAAEATNEFSGPSSQIYTWLKDIRDRAGIAAGTDGMYGMKANMTQEEMRIFLQRERQVELALEEHRFWDVRRWKTAPQVLNQDFHGMEITRASNGSYSYRTIVVRKNVFRDNMYFFPIPQSELTKSPSMKQNPGY
ncbi:MAG: RagB/SusD family nutrient uptake outer membrane protein [Sphingobacteriaceae bacterium]|nr:RagB/SusD family nutrient uptake outer membrane protein [Sphingobacteriaceae bacterium]